jgi:hypothetical protein
MHPYSFPYLHLYILALSYLMCKSECIPVCVDRNVHMILVSVRVDVCMNIRFHAIVLQVRERGVVHVV